MLVKTEVNKSDSLLNMNKNIKKDRRVRVVSDTS